MSFVLRLSIPIMDETENNLLSAEGVQFNADEKDELMDWLKNNL